MTKKNWVVDSSHSGIEFSARHMMIAKVKGRFESFEAQVEADPENLTTANIRIVIDPASVDTRSVDRDNHLRSADFFDAENHPQIVFQSTEIFRTGDDQYEVNGDVTLRGVTRKEIFTVTYEGGGKDPWGNEKVGFSGSGSIKRSDYGLTWNAALETGGVLVGDEIKLSIEIEAAAQA